MSDKVSDYHYELPRDLIAQRPAKRRDEARLLVVPEIGPFGHHTIRDLVSLVRPGDLLVVNESKVLPARLNGQKTTGARAEVLLLKPSGLGEDEDPALWEALVRPGRKLRAGHVVEIGDELSVEILEVLPSGNRLVRLKSDLDIETAIERNGSMPLPPYIDREIEPSDRDRYQTVYARTGGSVAAPTAGLHFTNDLLEEFETKGIKRTAITLHVGMGTFRPVNAEHPSGHPMHIERYFIPESAIEEVERTKRDGGRVWAVGTTAVRALESAARDGGSLRPGWAQTDLFIWPPHNFRVVDGLLTNFHLPRSTLIMLVAAFGGYERTMAAYEEAVRERYLFYSYGDAMLVVPSSG